MNNITYQAKLGELVLMVETTGYTNPELAEDMLKYGVTSPIVLISNGTKSRFGMKKISIKDGKKRLNLAASNKKIAQLTAQVILMDNSFDYVAIASPSKILSKSNNVEQYQDNNNNNNIYNWKNEKRNLFECCTPKELGQKYGIRMQYLQTVIQGKVKSTKGWSLT